MAVAGDRVCASGRAYIEGYLQAQRVLPRDYRYDCNESSVIPRLRLIVGEAGVLYRGKTFENLLRSGCLDDLTTSCMLRPDIS
jgi:hypothetical protein